MDLKAALSVRGNCEVFLKNTQALIAFINKNQNMKFLQMKNGEMELFQPKQQLLQSLDDYIAVLRKKKEEDIKVPQTTSQIAAQSQFDENECDIIETDRDHEIQRKQNIFVSPITAHFIRRSNEKAWANHSKSPTQERRSMPDSLFASASPEKQKESIIMQKFKFCEKNELFCQEIFDRFQNNYSQKYRGSILELGEYSSQNFDLQIKFQNMGKVLFRSSTLDLSENVDFRPGKPFNPQTFGGHKNFYSKDFDKRAFGKEEKKM